MDSDSRLKSLHRNLADLIPPRDLRAWGWWDFAFDHDRNDAQTLAAEALLHLGFDNDDTWRKAPLLVKALLVFVLEHDGRMPTREELMELQNLLNAHDRKAITDWFNRLF